MAEKFPLVSIVTPSLNQGRFIEENILSVKKQTYPRIEHIIIDAVSTDNTLDVIKKYDGAYNMRWVSEHDNGQSDALNKGCRMAKGEILAYLNSDDTYMPQAVETAVKFLNDHPDVTMVYGDCNFINEFSKAVGRFPAREFDLREMLCERNIVPEQATFFRREVLDKVGYPDVNLYVAMDWDFWIRIALSGFKVKYIPQLLANFRYYPGTKTVSQGYKSGPAHLYIIDKIFSNPELPDAARTLRRQAYSAAYLRVGLSYHAQRQMKQARKYLMKSIISYPRNLLRPWLAAYLVTSLLGRKATDIASSWRVKLASKKS
ncbi:glycosyltransferase family 2 protein [Chloroflexota bacterium]